MMQFGIFDNEPIGTGVYDKCGDVGDSNEVEKLSTKGRFRLHIVSVERNGVQIYIKG